MLIVADKESFAAAADHVSRTQSAVSQQMQRLEGQLGYTLFRKNGRNKVLTENGIKVRDYARRIVELNDQLMSTATSGGKFTVLGIGACFDVAETFLSLLLQKVSRSHPNILLEVHSARSPALMDALEQDELDLAITTRSDDSLISETLRVTPTVWICADGFAFDPQRPVNPACRKHFRSARLSPEHPRFHVLLTFCSPKRAQANRFRR